MTPTEKSVWEACLAQGCSGVRLPTVDKCWAHAEQQHVDVTLKRLGEDGQIDARGVLITTELLRRILAAVPHDAKGFPRLVNARFGDVVFGAATFEGWANFEGTTFEGVTLFDGATFEDGASFEGATFKS